MPTEFLPARRRILIVEDHLPTLEVLAKLLRRDGHEVVTASTFAAALAASQGRELDLLISDVGLPDGSGGELMVALRQTHGIAGIAVSGYGMESDLDQSRAAGFAAHVTKPVDLPTVRRLIDKVTGRKETEGRPGDAGPAAMEVVVPGGPH
ncbi:MAG TPA: response regulator [Lacunisphaera sp.]|nr:response regulator [Lacunisphaera sp.]